MCEPEGLIPRLLDVIEQDIVPMTRQNVASGNTLCGAAILHKSDLSLLLVETDNVRENPLWHGEVQAINRFFALPESARPRAGDCVFLSTHEPCPLCLSAIACSGFDNFFYLFAQDEGAASTRLPASRIMREVFGVAGRGYQTHNAYWNSYSLRSAVEVMPTPRRRELAGRIEHLGCLYGELSRSAAATPASSQAVAS